MMQQAQGNISNLGSVAVATGGSIGVGNVEVGGNLNGNIVIGNNNQVSKNAQTRRKKSSAKEFTYPRTFGESYR
jgi:hypothetical protein